MLTSVGLIFTATLAHAAPPACGTQFQYNCSAATLGGYTVITPFPSTGQTQIQGFLTSNAVVFNQTLPIPPAGSAASDDATQRKVLQADAQIAIQSGLAATLPACGSSPPCLAPNPGGSVVVTNSVTRSYVAQDTPVSQRVDQYSTTLKAILNGSQTVFQQTYAVPFSDPTVQAAVSTADAILTGDGATPGAPVQTSSSTTLQNSQLSYVLTSDTNPTGSTNVTTTNTFGPAAFAVGDNQDDVFIILSGQLDINVNTDFQLIAARNVVTTSTFLTTSLYTISGNSAAVTPAPASWMLVLTGLAVAGLLTWLRRLREAA